MFVHHPTFSFFEKKEKIRDLLFGAITFSVEIFFRKGKEE
jgi:hypothetical protein